MDLAQDLRSFIILDTSTLEPDCNIETENKQDFKWNSNQTKKLLDLYDTYRKDVSTMKIKTQRHLWKIISELLQKEFTVRITPENCANCWRVLERNYKKFTDNKNATGRGRKCFEYEEEMDKIFCKNKSVHPVILLSTETIDNPEETENVIDHSVVEKKSSIPVEPLTYKKRIRKERVSTMEKMRQDRKEYFQEKLKIERDKLQEMKERNGLIKERNQILREKNCQCNV